MEDSRWLHINEPGWEKELRRVGEELAQELFSQSTPANLQFWKDFQRAILAAGGIENLRIRFIVQDDFHPIALEALKERGEEYLMLQAPVYRREEVMPTLSPFDSRCLFSDQAPSREPLNFLLIQAQISTSYIFQEGDLKDVPLSSLDCLEDEIQSIEKSLYDLKAKGELIGEVRVLKPNDSDQDCLFSQAVYQVLKENRWHVVHYGGHTYDDPNHKTGYVFFPTHSTLSPIEPVKIDLFALWLKHAHTQFLFLSSCKSAEQDFIYRLSREGIPSIMGFLWKVEDSKASEYAKCFYKYLLGGKKKSLEYACLQAKKEMHAKYRDNPIWAAPVLITQVGI